MPEPYASEDVDQLVLEHRALMCVYGSAQARCTQEAASQALAVRRMQAQLMRLRAQVIVRDSQLAWEREDRKALEALVPGLPSRAAVFENTLAATANSYGAAATRHAALPQCQQHARHDDRQGQQLRIGHHPARTRAGIRHAPALQSLYLVKIPCRLPKQLLHGQEQRVQQAQHIISQ